MTKDERTLLLAAGVDAEAAIGRLMGKEHIFLKYLLRFPEDQNYEQLLTALSENDLNEAFRAIHTLKGASSTVGVISVYEIADPLTEKLRAACSQPSDRVLDFDEIASDVRRLGDAFQTACKAIRNLQSETG